MNLHCVHLHLAVAPAPPRWRDANTDVRTDTRATEDRAVNAANDNGAAWPLVPFPEGWCASN